MGTFCAVIGLVILIITFNVVRHIWEINEMMGEARAQKKRKDQEQGRP